MPLAAVVSWNAISLEDNIFARELRPPTYARAHAILCLKISIPSPTFDPLTIPDGAVILINEINN